VVSKRGRPKQLEDSNREKFLSRKRDKHEYFSRQQLYSKRRWLATTIRNGVTSTGKCSQSSLLRTSKLRLKCSTEHWLSWGFSWRTSNHPHNIRIVPEISTRRLPSICFQIPLIIRYNIYIYIYIYIYIVFSLRSWKRHIVKQEQKRRLLKCYVT
jgi:hypothetical protein